MKRAVWLKAGTVKVDLLDIDNIAEAEVGLDCMKKITKRKIKEAAKVLELEYDEEKIAFAKKILAYYMTEQ